MSFSESQGFEGRRVGLLARDLLDRVGDRWSALVICALYDRPARFSDLKVRIDDLGPRLLSRTEISHKMLAEALRGLRRDGLVELAQAEYALTPLGRSFYGPVMAVHDWTIAHLDEIEAARRRFDAAMTDPPVTC
jgi:DNA-binding HxlR family transcriptional regulator